MFKLVARSVLCDCHSACIIAYLFSAVLNHSTLPSGQTNRCQNRESTRMDKVMERTVAARPVTAALLKDSPLRCMSMHTPTSPAKGSRSHLITNYAAAKSISELQ